MLPPFRLTFLRFRAFAIFSAASHFRHYAMPALLSRY